MSIDVHTIESPVGSVLANADRILIGLQEGVANVAGAAAGAVVSTPVVFGNLPNNYVPIVNPGQAAIWWVSNKTNSGFTVNLVPAVSTNVLAAGAFDVAIFA